MVDTLRIAKFLDLLRGSYRTDEPQQNGVAERRNRTLMGMVRSMMSYSTLPLSLWMEASPARGAVWERPTRSSEDEGSATARRTARSSNGARPRRPAGQGWR